MISNANLLVKQGLLKRPLDFGFVMGDYISLYLPISPCSFKRPLDFGFVMGALSLALTLPPPHPYPGPEPSPSPSPSP